MTAKIKKMRRIGRKNRKEREMVCVRFVSFGEKLDVMKRKKLLRDRKECITDNLTEKEKRIEWLIKREADRKRGENLRVQKGYMKM